MKRLIIFSILVFVILIAVFVWPTLYKYDRIGRDGYALIRINRLTGKTERLTLDGWLKMEKPTLTEFDPSK